MKNKGKKNKKVAQIDEATIAKIMSSQVNSAGGSDDEDYDEDFDLSSGDEDAEDIDFGNEGDSEEADDEEEENEADDDNEEHTNGNSVDKGDDEESVDAEESDVDEDELGSTSQHKKVLNSLKDTDPTFYKFLLENDKDLLNFEDSDPDSSADESEKVHKPPELLEEDSDNSDFEKDDEFTGDQINVTNKMIDDWTTNMQSECSLDVVAEVVKAFQSAIVQLHGNDEQSEDLKYHFAGAGQFNTLMQTCLSYMFSAIKKILKMPGNLSVAQPLKSKRWKKTRQHIKLYLDTLVKYLSLVSSEEVQSVMLKHFHQMSVFVVCFPKLTKPTLKLLVKLWSEGLSQPVRILAFLCLTRLACNRQNQMLETVLKVMYVTYVRNTRFVSPGNLANISFMRLSLVELFAVDEAAAYQQAFLYIRQLAIHLRNAVRVHKKETLQTVCNWQFVSSLQLWVTLLAKSMKSSPLKMLLYPIIEITLGVVQLFSSSQYYPMRFHCAKLLTFICRCSPTFVPVLPLVVDVLEAYDFNKKHKHVSMKPLAFTCILRVNKHQLLENSFKDAVLEQIYSILLEYLMSQSYSLAFPDLVVPLISQLNKFTSTCKVAAFVKKLKSLQDKIEENNKFIEKARKARNVNLSNDSDVDAWDVFVRSKVSPLDAFYQSWRKAVEEKKIRRQKEDFDEKSVPRIKKHPQKAASDGPPELFPSDDEDDSDMDILKHAGMSDEEEEAEVEESIKRKIEPIEERPAKKRKPIEVAPNEAADIIEDLDDF